MADSRPSLTAPVPALEHTPYSTLEVDYDRWIEKDGKAAPIVVQDLRNKSFYSDSDSDEKIAGYDNGKITYNDVDKQTVVNDASNAQLESTRPTEERRIFGLRRKTFFILLSVVLVLILAAIIGGAVGGTIAARNRKQTTIVPTNSSIPVTREQYANTGLAPMQWTDLNGTLHKRVYYQDSNNKIRESAWDNNTAFNTAWAINAISDAVKPGTPIAAAAGYPHASYNYSSVKNAYYMSTNNEFIERQAASNDSQAWSDNNFSGLYTGSNSTFLTAYWHQNIQNASEELVVLFQQDNFADGLTQGRYTSNKTTSNPWVAQNFGFSQPPGNTFAMSLVSYRSGKHLMLYTVDDSNDLQQHEYTISDTDLVSTSTVALTSQTSTNLTVQARSPLAVVAQDNQPLYATDTTPECMQDTPLANLILYTVPDRSSLVLNAWNCTTGFVDQTPAIAPLQKPNTTYLSLAAMSDHLTGDGNVYIMFDSGSGPQVEEWTVPTLAGDPWVTSRNVTVDFAL